MGLAMMAWAICCLGVLSAVALAVGVEIGIRRLLKAGSAKSRLWSALLRWPLLSLILLGTCVLASFSFVGKALLEATVREGTHATYEEAHHALYLARLSPDATDINYYSVYMGAEADFLISESDFLKWCESQGWTPVEIPQEDTPIPILIHFRQPGREDVEVRRGLTCGEDRDPSGVGILYDRNSGRAYYQFAAW